MINELRINGGRVKSENADGANGVDGDVVVEVVVVMWWW